LILVFVSSSMILVNSLPGLLQPLARNQPLTQVCNAVRGLVQGDAGAALVAGQNRALRDHVVDLVRADHARVRAAS